MCTGLPPALRSPHPQNPRKPWVPPHITRTAALEARITTPMGPPTRHHGRASTCLPAAPTTDPTRQEEQQGSEKPRKLNPLETLLKVYTQASGRRDATRPDRQYPFFTGLPLKPYFDRCTCVRRWSGPLYGGGWFLSGEGKAHQFQVVSMINVDQNASIWMAGYAVNPILVYLVLHVSDFDEDKKQVFAQTRKALGSVRY